MNPNQPPSTPNLQPQQDPIAMAMARRGMGVPSPQATQMTQGTPPPQSPQPPASGPSMGASPKQEFVPKDGHEFVLSTLAEQLKNDHKLEMEKLKMNSPMMPVTQPQGGMA